MNWRSGAGVSDGKKYIYYVPIVTSREVYAGAVAAQRHFALLHVLEAVRRR